MALPWVSRELYDLALEDLRRSEEERKALLDRLLGQHGIPPLAALAEVLPQPGTREAEQMVDEGTGALNIPKVIALANAAAKKRAGV